MRENYSNFENQVDNELFKFEALLGDLEDGEQIPEEDLLWATEKGIDSLTGAKQALIELREYRDPIITVPAMYADELRSEGKMNAHMTWDNTKAIRGRVNVEYEGLEDEPRIAFKVLPHVKLQPRFTTKSTDNKPKFYGVFEVDPNNPPLIIGQDIIEISKNENANSH